MLRLLAAIALTAYLLASAPLPAAAQCICARYIRPYSDNAYSWGEGECGFTADPNALIADNIEMYDPEYGCDTPLYTKTCCNRTNSCAEYIDCDGPETALPDPITDPALPAGWAQVPTPCLVDTPARILRDATAAYLQSTTPYSCVAMCDAQGFAYAGVEYGDECYCGTYYAGEPADASECDMRCAGSYYYTCGGSWRIQIYGKVG